MSPCIESIKLMDGEMPLLEWHEKRFKETSFLMYSIKRRKTLSQYLQNLNLPVIGLYKVKLIYDKRKVSFQLEAYKFTNHRTVELRIDECISYSIKSKDRSELDRHMASTLADDFIIVQNDNLTDAWYSNVAFLQNGKWYTPFSHLLNGVKRQMLIRSGFMEEREIKASQLSAFEQIAFINAMRDFEKKYTFRQEGNLLYLKEVPQ